MSGSSPRPEQKKMAATAVKKSASIKAESETQTAVAVRVPSIKKVPSDVKAAAENLVTDEQAHSASMARKRRMITKNRAQGVRTREKTPEPSRSYVPHEDTTTTDEEDTRSPQKPLESEDDDIYLETKKKLQEKTTARDEDDIDIEAIREAHAAQAQERRRRSISPFALPSKEEIEGLQRRSSFIDPGNKLLSTVATYALTPKDDIDYSSRKNSLIAADENELERKDSLKIPSSVTPVATTLSKSNQLSTPPNRKKLQGSNPVPNKAPSTVASPQMPTMQANVPKTQPIAPVKNDPAPPKPKTPILKMSTNANTANVEQPKPPLVEPANVPPIKPKRSKSGTRSQGRTSESEMSEDQSRKKDAEQQTQRAPKPKERRRTIAAIKRSVRERSPAVERSKSVTKVEDSLDPTGGQLSKASSEIIELLQKARRSSLSMPDDEEKLSKAGEIDKNRQLATPRRTPVRVTSPKTIQLLTKEEILENFKEAQRKSMEIERSRHSSGYIDASQSEITSSCYSSSYSEDDSDFDLTKKSAELSKKLSILHFDMESNKNKEEQKEVTKPKVEQTVSQLEEELLKDLPVTRKEKFKFMLKNCRKFWRIFKSEQEAECVKIKSLRNVCFCDLLIVMLFCGAGGFIFRYTEGSFENFYKCGVKRVKRDFIDTLWQGSHNLREDDWKSMARRKLWEMETQLSTAHEAGVHSYSGKKSWSYLNSVLYCLTVVTTIGYGHIAPSTTAGRAFTIVYAVFGIPLFLILLADFGKLFTRCIKFFWAFVRRLYYTGSLRKMRRTVPVQEMMKGLNIMYEAASTLRRPSQFNVDEEQPSDAPPRLPPKPTHLSPNQPPTRQDSTEEQDGNQTPAPSIFEIDDEFNLPISVAIVCLVIYIFAGAVLYNIWEKWSFFESFYFVFISMSTIGFGDFVPDHPIFMMASIVYLVFGMALTSMCINVVQVKLSDSFRQASAKIGATIGLKVSEEDGSLAPITPAPVEIPAVHGANKNSEDSSSAVN